MAAAAAARHAPSTSSSARRLSLRGRAFTFHGVARARREHWTRVLRDRDAAVFATFRPATATATEVLVVTDCWVDALPASSPSCAVVCVTEFWLRELLARGAWLAPDAHPLFAPPPRGARGVNLLSYPMEYDAALDAGDEWRAMLPCSPFNLHEDAAPLWPYMAAYLDRPIDTTQQLASAIQSIVGDTRHQLNCLEMAIDGLMSPTDRQTLFGTVLPTMQRLVLDLPSQFRSSFRLLPPMPSSSSSSPASRALQTASVNLSRVQLLTLLSCMFFALFPGQQHVPRVAFPWFSMEKMLSAPRSMGDFVELKAHKIRTILEYFLRVVPRFLRAPHELEDEVVTFTRVALQLQTPLASATAASSSLSAATLLHALSATPSLSPLSTAPTSCVMSDVRVETNALIEDLHTHLQMDFANKYAGGGVMNGGAVQEEIRFMLSPELLAACLVFARLEPHESFVVHGSERFSNYSGYGGTFRFGGSSAPDASPFAALDERRRRRQSVVVGIDAISYSGHNVSRQYTRACVSRDLVKALAGFAYPAPECATWPIATGNWGCGVFRGDAELKFLIQWLAASLAGGRALVYVVFERASDLERKIAALLRARPTAQWLLEFMFALETELGPRPQATTAAAAAGRRGRGDGSSTGRGAGASVLDRAVAFVQAKAAAAAPSSSSSIVGGSGSLTTAEPAAASTATPSAPCGGGAVAVTPTRQRSSGGDTTGPQLKQPKLTAFWK